MRSSRSSVLSPWKNGFKYRPDYKPRNMHRQESRSLIILVLRRGGDARTLQRSPSQRPHTRSIQNVGRSLLHRKLRQGGLVNGPSLFVRDAGGSNRGHQHPEPKRQSAEHAPCQCNPATTASSWEFIGASSNVMGV